MHSVFSRINNVSALLSSCMMALLAAIALSSFVLTAYPKGDLGVLSVKVYPATTRKGPHKQQEMAFVNFNATADLSPLFHWNTKQLFVWIEAEYNNTKNAENTVVIWDRIIRRKEDANLQVSAKNKYMFRELSKSFKHAQPAYYSLKYNLMPYVGVLTYGEAARTKAAIEFPPSQKRVP